MAFFTAAAGVLGGLGAVKGLLGGGDKNGGAGVQTVNRDPWQPAQKYLLKNLETNQNLQDYYAQNPFSDTQKTQYQGLLDTLANNQSAGNGLLNWASNFGQSKRGVMPAMTALPTGTKAAPIDWDKMNQYQSQGNFSTTPTTYQAGQSGDADWEQVLADYNAASQARFGTPMNRDWSADADAQRQYQVLQDQYQAKKKNR